MVVNTKDYEKILSTGCIPVGRENYYPLNWSQNPVEAIRFMDYLLRANYEKKAGDYRMIALPLDMKVGSGRTKAPEGFGQGANTDQQLKLQDFNRHYGSYYHFYKKDEMAEHPTTVRKYMASQPTTIDFPQVTRDDPMGMNTMEGSQLPIPPTTTPLPEDHYHGWVELNTNQLLHLHAWHIPQGAMDYYMKNYQKDQEVYSDFTTYYREQELMQASPAYGGILNGPSWARFVQWWHRTNRTYTISNPERQKELKSELANFLDEDGWNYITAISHGCIKLVDPSEIEEYKELNYLILQACYYYENADKETWTSPLLVKLRGNQELPTTQGTMIPSAKSNCITNERAIDTMVDFGTTDIDTMQKAWTEAVNTTTGSSSGNMDLETTMSMIRKDVTITKRSRQEPPRSRL